MGEKDKERRWKEAIKSRRDRVAHEVKFVPFCVEAVDGHLIAHGLWTECVHYLLPHMPAAVFVMPDVKLHKGDRAAAQ